MAVERMNLSERIGVGALITLGIGGFVTLGIFKNISRDHDEAIRENNEKQVIVQLQKDGFSPNQAEFMYIDDNKVRLDLKLGSCAVGQAEATVWIAKDKITDVSDYYFADGVPTNETFNSLEELTAAVGTDHGC